MAWVLLVWLALPHVAWAGAEEAGPPTARVLREGADAVVLVEDHRAPVVKLVIELPAGKWSPWARRQHAEEAFEIQLYDRGQTLRRRADDLGAEVSLRVSDEYSRLSLRCLKEDLPQALRLVRDVLANRDFDPGELQRRRYARPAVWRGLQKDPQTRLVRELALRAYRPGDPRRRFAEGPERLLTDAGKLAAARDALLRLPGRVIAFAGDVGPDEALRLAAGLLPPPLPGPADVLPVLPALATTPGDLDVRMDPLNQVYFAYARDGLAETDPDYPAFLVANQVLAGPGHMRSRLGLALRIDGGSTYSARGEELEDFAAGAYYLTTFTRSAGAGFVEQRLRQEVRRLQQGGITEEERQAAVDSLRGRRARERRSPGAVLSRYLFERRHGLPAGWQDQLADRAAALPLSAINAFIRRFYDPARFTLLRLVPGR